MSHTDTHTEDADAPIDHVEFLLFELADATYALELGRVRQTMEVPETSRVPNAPRIVDGVASVAGDVVVVVDARTAFGVDAPRTGPRDPTILLLDHGGAETMEDVGLIVDNVADVVTVHVDQLRPIDEVAPPAHGGGEWFRAAVVDEGGTASTYVLDTATLVGAIGDRE
jgi:chemotaxis signal transduction protein